MSNEFIAINHEVYTFRIPRAAIDVPNSAPVEVGSDFMSGQSGVLQGCDLWQMQMDIQTIDKAKVIPLGWQNYAAQRHEALRANDGWRKDQRSRSAKQKNYDE